MALEAPDMAYTRSILYMVGLLIVVAAAWVFLTQTPVGDTIPASVALALILLLVGVGVMASARAMDDTFYARRRRVVHDADPLAPTVPAARTTTYREPAYATTYREPAVPPPTSGTEEYVEERRY